MRLIASCSWLLLVLIGCTNKYDQFKEVNRLPEMFDESSIDRYLLTQYKTVDLEQIRIIYYKNDLYLSDEMVIEGSRQEVSMPILDIIARCSIRNCNQIVYAHNHVGQYFAKPSTADLDTTDLLKERLAIANIKLNMVVVADHDTYWIR